MICTCDPDQTLWFGRSFEDAFHDVAWAVLVVIATDEELWLGAIGQKLVGVVTSFRMDWNAKAYETLYLGISTTGAQADV